VVFPLIAAGLAGLACLLVGSTAGLLVRKMRPRQAVVLLGAASLAVSLAAGLALSAIAVAMLASLKSVAAEGHWSASVIRAAVPVPGWLGALATMAVGILLWRAVVRIVAILLALARADLLCRRLRAGRGPVVMIDDDSADAFTVAGLRGRVVISRRLFSRLSGDERRVLTAHELSHLYQRHHLYVHAADIAAAANPLLRQVPAAVRLGVERWADEDAATEVGDRRVAGQALARVALVRSSLARGTSPQRQSRMGRAGHAALGVGGLQVASRVQALLQPARRPRTGRSAIAVGLSLAVLLVGVASLENIHDAIQNAAPYLHHAHRS
jgi:beta-lactamase regulating signal transducer with metallopeptidase domain